MQADHDALMRRYREAESRLWQIPGLASVTAFEETWSADSGHPARQTGFRITAEPTADADAVLVAACALLGEVEMARAGDAVEAPLGGAYTYLESPASRERRRLARQREHAEQVQRGQDVARSLRGTASWGLPDIAGTEVESSVARLAQHLPSEPRQVSFQDSRGNWRLGVLLRGPGHGGGIRVVTVAAYRNVGLLGDPPGVQRFKAKSQHVGAGAYVILEHGDPQFARLLRHLPERVATWQAEGGRGAAYAAVVDSCVGWHDLGVTHNGLGRSGVDRWLRERGNAGMPARGRAAPGAGASALGV